MQWQGVGKEIPEGYCGALGVQHSRGDEKRSDKFDTFNPRDERQMKTIGGQLRYMILMPDMIIVFSDV